MLSNTFHPNIKQPILKDCITTGITNEKCSGFTYEYIALLDDWYFQYQSLKAENRRTGPLHRVINPDGKIHITSQSLPSTTSRYTCKHPLLRQSSSNKEFPIVSYLSYHTFVHSQSLLSQRGNPFTSIVHNHIDPAK